MDGENALQVQKTGHSGEAGNAKELREAHTATCYPWVWSSHSISISFYILKYFIKKMNMIKYYILNYIHFHTF